MKHIFDTLIVKNVQLENENRMANKNEVSMRQYQRNENGDGNMFELFQKNTFDNLH